MNATAKTAYTERLLTQRSDPILEELRAVRVELRASREEQTRLRRLLDEYFGVALNARYKFGRPTDRWARR